MDAGHIPRLSEIRGAAKEDERLILLVPDPAEAAGLLDEIWIYIDDLWTGPCSAVVLVTRFERLLDGLKLRREQPTLFLRVCTAG